MWGPELDDATKQTDVVSPRARALWVASPTLSTGLVTVLVACPMPVVVCDDLGLVIGWNEHATNLFGWSAREAIGLPMEHLVVPKEHRHRHRAALERRRSAGDAKIIDRSVATDAQTKECGVIPVDIRFSSGVEYGRMFYVFFFSDRRRLRGHINCRARAMFSKIFSNNQRLTGRGLPGASSSLGLQPKRI